MKAVEADQAELERIPTIKDTVPAGLRQGHLPVLQPAAVARRLDTVLNHQDHRAITRLLLHTIRRQDRDQQVLPRRQ